LKKLILILAALLFLHCAPQKKSLGILQVSFQFNKAKSDVDPSYQIAIWLEDSAENYVKTLFLSEYLSYGGYNDSTICPNWNSKAAWDKAPMDEYDAVTHPTPPVGDNMFEFGLDSLGIESGDYFCCVQAHLIENYNILYKNKINLNRVGATSGDAEYEPSVYEGAEAVLTNVTARIIKEQN